MVSIFDSLLDLPFLTSQDPKGCINTLNLLVPDVTAEEIQQVRELVRNLHSAQ
jgi:hypothetical protein